MSLLLLLLAFSCSEKKDNVAGHESPDRDSSIVADAFEVIRPAPSFEWMCLSDSNTWIPVVGPVEEVLNESRICFLKADYEKAAERLLRAAEILNKSKTGVSQTQEQLTQVAGEVKDLAEKTKNEKTSLSELDSNIRKICDMSMKNCWFEVHQDMWIEEGEVERYLSEAYNMYLEKDNRASSREVKKAKGLVQIENKKYCKEPDDKHLEYVMNELEMLATDLEAGKTISNQAMKTKLHRSFYYLAKHHTVNSYKTWAENARENTGRELKAAARYTLLSAKWHGKELNQSEKNVIDHCMQLGEELEKKVSHTTEEVDSALNELKLILENLR